MRDAAAMARHKKLLKSQEAAEQAKQRVKVRLMVHGICGKDLIAVDDRRYEMSSDPILSARLGGGPSASTRPIKRTLNPRWDEWLLCDSLPFSLKSKPAPAGAPPEVSNDFALRAKAELLKKVRNMTLRVEVTDFDASSDNDPLGQREFLLSQIIDEGVAGRKGYFELQGEWSLQYMAGMAKQYKTAMKGSLELRLQLIIPPLPATFQIQGNLTRTTPKLANIDRRIRFKPFRCEHCGRRFKQSSTLALHLDLHRREQRARDRIEEEMQHQEEAAKKKINAERKRQKDGAKRSQRLDGRGAVSSRGAVARSASTKISWVEDCQMGRLNAVSRGIDLGQFLLDERDAKGRTPLIIAARWGEEALVKHLISRKPNLNARDMYGNTAIALACQYGFLSIVRMLKDKGADAEIANVSGLTPLHRAACYDNEDVIKFLLLYTNLHDELDSAKRSALDYATMYGNKSSAKILNDVTEARRGRVRDGH